MGSLGITELLVIAVIVIVLFGTKKLRNIGSDLGSAVKGFKQAMKQADEPEQLNNPPSNNSTNQTIENQKDKSQS